MKFKVKNIKKKLFSLIVSFFISSLIFYSFFVFQKEEISADSNLERFHALSKLTDVANSIQREIQSSIVYTDFFSIIISHNPDIKPEILEIYSYWALKHNKNIKSVQFAPNAVIQTVYPRAGNEAALGHDLLGDPARAVFAQKAIEKRTVILQGPVLAKQGGFLMFNRKAIFIESDEGEDFWGLAVVAIDFDKLIEKYQTSLKDVNYLFALRSNNNKIQENLFGLFEVFEKKSIIKAINVADTTWELAIYPKDGWKDERSFFHYFNKFLYFIFIIIFILLYLTVKNYLKKISDLKKDPLTNTLNRNTIVKVVNKRLHRKEDSFAFLVMDVNDFKLINDNLGHYVGDCVLVEIASRLDSVLREGDSLSRFGGDEYIVILDCVDKDVALDDVIQRMVEEVAKPMIIEGHSLRIGIAIGYAKFPNEGASYNELYQVADSKMYEYKKENKLKFKSTYK
ncbi:MAG: diguanylate cyclase [Pseudomonas sp.]|nr:diguanylate cyclase [Pseudomonas sp.]